MKLNINNPPITIAKIITLAFLLVFANSAFAQTDSTQTDRTAKKPATNSFSKRGFAGAPYVRYEPETGWVGGLVGMYYFHLGPDTNDKRTRPSDVSAGASYSQLHQSSVGINYDLYFTHDAYHLGGGFHYQQVPLQFFGVGDHTPSNSIDDYTPLYRGLTFQLTKNLFRSRRGEGLNAGIEGEFRNDAVLKSDSGGLIATNRVPGARGGVTNGLGALVIYDTRDNTYSTHEGQYEDFEAEFYGHTLRSDYAISRYRLDVRRFFPISDDQTIAAQFYGVISNGTVPFYMMDGLGGDQKVRGYYLLRFRDNDVGLLQAEWRFPIWWRFGGVIFADGGEVGHTLSSFSIGGIHPSAGVGLRLLVVPAEHLNARLDYGIGTDSKEIYFSILEAF
ncbi:MAG TPA: BamA/TamA family outer membrane protein [Candidatus Kapabacteria bacterium]|nr:BamA/TamA family outer membrane protein [Candidatus Kapabacteria bacterium]